MEIIPTYVTFEQSKLLKKKRFDERTTVWRQHGNGISGDVEGKKDYYNRKGDVYTSLPEQWQVIEWLRLNHNIWVEVYIDDDQTYGYFITRFIKEGRLDYPLKRKFRSPQEAYSVAFDYILKKLLWKHTK